MLTVVLSVDRGRKANSHFLQNVSKQSTASHVHLSPQIDMACVAWCGIGRPELRNQYLLTTMTGIVKMLGVRNKPDWLWY